MFKSGQILQHRRNKALIRILKPHPSYGHEVLTSYFFASMSDAVSFENYQPAPFHQWVKATWPHLKDQYRKRNENNQSTIVWLIKLFKLVRQAYLPIWRLS